MGLYPEDIEVTGARDEDEHLHSYSWLGEQGKRIRTILQGIAPHDDLGAIKRWGVYLEQHLSFPFDAKVEEWQERGPLRTGDRVKVKNISLVDDLTGVIVALRRGREKFDCPLCELAVLDRTSSNTLLIKDYRVWFANH